MKEQRRYRDDEVAEIFALAARDETASPRELHGEAGLTLAELQEVAREVGIHPDRIAEAARQLTIPSKVVPAKKILGVPLTVGRVVDLPRALSEQEWEIVVSDLRDTFSATGRLRTLGAAKEWANGNLRVLLEPTGSGQRLRMTTLNSRYRFLGGYGIFSLVFVAVMLLSVLPQLIATGGFDAEIFAQFLPALIAAAAGAGALTMTRLNLPAWAEERSAQMEAIAGRVLTLAEKTPAGKADVGTADAGTADAGTADAGYQMPDTR